MRSRIYKGYVEHIRFTPVWHRLNYPLYFYCFDLDELPQLDQTVPILGYNRFRPVSVYDTDYLDEGPGTIQEKLLRHIKMAGCPEKISRISMITSARYFSRVFNPVNFYYCFSPDETVACIVAEVNNTYGERHVYVMKNSDAKSGGFPILTSIDKSFHVSPFNDTSGMYEMSFSDIADDIEIHIDLYKSGEKAFGAVLQGKAKPFSLKNLIFVLSRHPLIPHLTLPRIYVEAAKLHFRKKLNMYDKPAPRSAMTIRKIPPSLVQKQFVKIARMVLPRINKGSLQLVQPDGSMETFGDTTQGMAARLLINDNRFYTGVITGGEIGFGEAYVDGYWDSDDLVTLLKLLIDNRKSISDGNLAISLISRIRDYALHLTRANTISGIRRNIAEHYDLSNEFFSMFLDPSMTYSCGLFLSDQETLEQAQTNKIRRIIELAGICRDDHVLEIGCGWGSFAIEAVQRTGCRVTGITVSKQQYEYMKQRVANEGLADRITILLEDYRTVEGLYDKIVSIEMLEAVGHEYLGSFFACCDRLLCPDGLAVIQVITIPDQRYSSHKWESNWIRKHIFPGGHLPSLTAMCDAMTAHSSLMIEHMENIGIHYVRTLKNWRLRFAGSAGKLSALGFDRAFQRKWLYYFSICEAQFALRAIADLQMVLTREGNTKLAIP